MSNPVNLVGNPIPPGVNVPAGANTMPSYPTARGTPWPVPMDGNPAPPSVTKHTGDLANWYVVRHKLARPWSNLYHEMIREGQLVFTARTKSEDDDMETIVNLYQLNAILREGYLRAMDIVNGNVNIPTGVTMGLQDIRDAIDKVSEGDIEEYLGRENDMEMEVPDDPTYKPMLRNALTLARSKIFRYLWAPGISFHWNFWGTVNNISVGTSPEHRAMKNNSHFNSKSSAAVVVNAVVGKKGFISNIFGGSDRVQEGSTLYLVLRRRKNRKNQWTEFEIVPYCHPERDEVPFDEKLYEDHVGSFTRGGDGSVLIPNIREGYTYTIGTCSEVTRRDPTPHKLRQAVGNGETTMLSQAHDATGTLPKICVQFRV